MTRYRLTLSTPLAAPVATVWAQVSTLAGVNRELWPLVMTAPRDARIDARTPLGTVAFRSLLLWRGLIPMDLHWLRMESVCPGQGFQEASWSLSEREWRHRRTLTETPEGCCVEDEVGFTPRLAGPLLCRIVQATFERRHRRLSGGFGALAPTRLSLIENPGADAPR